MSVRNNNSPTDVLHIRPDWGDQAIEIEAMLEADSLTVEVCPDVYRGLARLCVDPTNSAPRAVIVCVDDLGPAELEFFSIVARLCRGIPVYVYGQERYSFRLAKAIELGARGPVTVETIHSMGVKHPAQEPEPIAVEEKMAELVAERLPPEPAKTEPPKAEVSPRQTVDPVTAPNLDEVPPPEAEAVEPETEIKPESEHEPEPTERTTPSRRARVPWLRYGDRPTRAAPQRIPPKPAPMPTEEFPTDADADGETSPSRPSPPLLTQAELQALLGDDIAAIAPDEPRDLASDGTFDEEGTR